MLPPSRPQALESHDDGHGIVVRFGSRGIMLDCEYREVLRRDLFRLAEELGERSLILDLAAVEYVFSDVLSILVALHQRLRATGGHLMLCNVRPKVFKIFELTHLHQVLDVHMADQAAQNSCT
jgi:anti-anti-sigma factor